MDQREQIARIARMQEETRKFVAETRQIDRMHMLPGWLLVIIGMTAGAALVAATMAFIKWVR